MGHPGIICSDLLAIDILGCSHRLSWSYPGSSHDFIYPLPNLGKQPPVLLAVHNHSESRYGSTMQGSSAFVNVTVTGWWCLRTGDGASKLLQGGRFDSLLIAGPQSTCDIV